MNLILNEKEYAIKLLDQSISSQKLSYDVMVLGKYFCHEQQLKPDEIYKKLVTYVSDHYNNLSISQYQDMLLKIARKAKKKDLIQISYIPITAAELNTIDYIKCKPAKRVAFTLLCLAKFKNLVNPSNNNWLNYEFKDIFRMANVAMTIKEQCSLIYNMRNDGFITTSKMVNNLSIHVEFIDNLDTSALLQISDFRCLGYEYLSYCKEKFYRCETCGILVRKTNNKAKYCKECGILENRKKTKMRVTSLRETHVV